MKWKAYQLKDGTNARETIASDAGYGILRTRASIPGVMAGAAPYRYIAFHGRTGDSHFRVLGGYDTAEEAKAACAAHEAKSREVAA